MTEERSHLLEPKELELVLDQENLVIIDLGNPLLYRQRHVPGAIHLTSSCLMSSLPPAVGKHPSILEVTTIIQQLGIDSTKHIVVYDDEGGGWAGRLAWLLDLIGLDRWSYLNGGIVAWINEGHVTESLVRTAEPSNFRPGNTFANPSAAITVDQIIANIGTETFAIWDARSPAEFSGALRSSLRGGHIPGAINLEWTQLMDQDNNLRIRTNAQELLNSFGLGKDKKIATHCQTHHRSSFTYMVARILGYKNISGYDGSWSEWGNLEYTPVELGP